jgi:hypothetical protein
MPLYGADNTFLSPESSVFNIYEENNAREKITFIDNRFSYACNIIDNNNTYLG